MPTPDYSGLNATPASLLTFMENNIVLSGFLKNSKVNSVPEYLELPSLDSVAKKDNTTISAFKLKNSDKTSASEALHAYICNYTAGNVEYCRLGTAANLCFTITMNGCTFGVGQPAPDGTLLVTHANTGGKTTPQQEQTFGAHGTKQVSMLEPALYRRAGSNMNATTFGIRTKGKWKFYFQLYSVKSFVYTLIGVFPVPTQQFTG